MRLQLWILCSNEELQKSTPISPNDKNLAVKITSNIMDTLQQQSNATSVKWNL